MKTTRTDKIVIECSCLMPLTEELWDEHKEIIKSFMKKHVKNGLSYKIYRSPKTSQQ